MTVQFASLHSSQRQRILSGAAQRVEIIYTRTALSNGQGAKLGKKSDVYIGKTFLDAAENIDWTDALSAVRHGRKMRKRSSESRRLGRSTARDT